MLRSTPNGNVALRYFHVPPIIPIILILSGIIKLPRHSTLNHLLPMLICVGYTVQAGPSGVLLDIDTVRFICGERECDGEKRIS